MQTKQPPAVELSYQMELGYDNWYDNSLAGGSPPKRCPKTQKCLARGHMDLARGAYSSVHALVGACSVPSDGRSLLWGGRSRAAGPAASRPQGRALLHVLRCPPDGAASQFQR